MKLGLGTILLAAIITSCKTKEIELSEIEGIPDIVKGCSCIFARSEEDFTNERYVYINTADLSVLSIKDELVIWTQLDPEPPFKVLTIYEREERIATELTELEGNMIITDKEGVSMTLKVFGQCGC